MGVRIDKCRSCGTKMVWALYWKKGATRPKPIPFDLEPTDKGRYYLFHPDGDMDKLEARYIENDQVWPPGSLPRQNHFGNCPARSHWKGRSRKEQRTPEEQAAIDRAVELQRAAEAAQMKLEESDGHPPSATPRR